MKINKVLLGLFAGVLALMGSNSYAQFYEMGPSNIGGHVSSLLLDESDQTQGTLYAGAVSGGLYVRSTNQDVLQNLYADVDDEAIRQKLVADTNSWHLVRYYDATLQEMTLPISALAQAPDGSIIIGTGDDIHPVGSTYGKMSSKGRGIYRYTPSNGKFARMASTDPEQTENFSAIHGLAIYSTETTVYLFAATPSGLFRWSIALDGSGAGWDGNFERVAAGNVDQLLVIRQLGIAYFTIGNQLYRVNDLTATGASLKATNISSSNAAFGGTNTAIKLAVAPSDNRYLYAMVINAQGQMENIYLSTNGQTWLALATETVLPFSSNSGTQCGAIAVDPENPKRVVIGGSSVWVGEGFLEGLRYQWSRKSMPESTLNYGNYMSQVFNSGIFVHSGINQILPVYKPNRTGSNNFTYYIATEGGIYSTNTFYYFDNINRGLNNVQINSVAVTPDGSIISGANANACPFIESRMAHYGGSPIVTWYDDGSLGNINHDAVVLWHDNGGKVAASAFQQVSVRPQRNIFVSAANGDYGRSYADYFDYTNSTTWTSGVPFLTEMFTGGPTVGNLHLWESADDRYYQDSIDVTLDLRGVIYRKNGTVDSINLDTTKTVKEGDTAIFLSRNNSDYPFKYVFSKADNNKKVTSTFRVKNPIVSRLLAVGQIGPTQSSVLYSWTASDFSKIFDSVIDHASPARDEIDATVQAQLREKFMWWVPILTVRRSEIAKTTHLYPREAVMSPDGRFAYISTYDDSLHRSQFYRVSGFENVNFMAYPTTIQSQMNAVSGEDDRVLRNTMFTRKVNNQDVQWFDRPISSIAVDPREGFDRVVLTFEDYSSGYANVAVINNASTDNWTIERFPITDHETTPAYCAMIEQTTGNIYVGTADGIFIHDGASWHEYQYLRGVPVTSIVQQTQSLQVKRASNHTGITENKYVFAKTKWPRAIYFGTYGRGIFMDMTYVEDMENEILDSSDYMPVSIPTVAGNSNTTISIYPNPVVGQAHLSIDAAEAGVASLRIYDLNGRVVENRVLGHVEEGQHTFAVPTEGLSKGMYLVNVIIGGHTSATKMVVR